MLQNKANTVFAHPHVATMIFDHSSTADMVKISRVSSLVHSALRDRIRQRLATYLSRWFPYGTLMQEMRETSLSVFDQSSFAFLNCQPDTLWSLQTLYMVCLPSDKGRVIDFISEHNYERIPCSRAKKQAYHLSLNKFISGVVTFRRGNLTVTVATAKNNSIVQAALGTVSTGFMNIIGPKSFWSAYRTGPGGSESYQNPSYGTGPCPSDFPVKIDYAHDICKATTISNHLLMWRILVERPHKTFCYTHPECPQSLRSSNDSHCSTMYFGMDHRSATRKQYREQINRNGDPVLWRLGGTCYKNTLAMTPICTAVTDFDKPLSEH